MTERTLTAMYDSRTNAENARDQLVGLGIATGDISIRGTDAAADTTEERGFWASLFMPDDDRYTYEEGVRRGGYLLTARVPDGMDDAALDVLDRSGAVDLDERSSSWRQEGWTGSRAGVSAAYGEGAGLAEASPGFAADSTTRYGSSEARSSSLLGREGATREATGEDVVQVAEEQLRVGKREADRGNVRVRSYVVERPVEEQVDLREERVTIERRPVNREVTAGDTVFEEKVIEAVERDEEAVVSKQARVVEEIALGKDVNTRTETVRDTVRKQEVEIEDDRTSAGVTDADRLATRRDVTDR